MRKVSVNLHRQVVVQPSFTSNTMHLHPVHFRQEAGLRHCISGNIEGFLQRDSQLLLSFDRTKNLQLNLSPAAGPWLTARDGQSGAPDSGSIRPGTGWRSFAQAFLAAAAGESGSMDNSTFSTSSLDFPSKKRLFHSCCSSVCRFRLVATAAQRLDE